MCLKSTELSSKTAGAPFVNKQLTVFASKVTLSYMLFFVIINQPNAQNIEDFQ